MTPLEPYLTVRAVQPLVAALEVLGHPAQALLREVAISPAALENPDGQVPHRAVMALWERARAVSGDDFLGIHLALAAPVRTFEVHAYAFLSSPTLRDAYRRSCRYQRLIHEITELKFEEGDQEGVLSHGLPGGRPVPRQPAEFLATLWVRFGRLVTGDEWTPNRVRFAHAAPADLSEYARVFRAPVQFSSGCTAMHVANSILDAPNPRGDAGLVQVLDQYARTLLLRLPRRTTLSEQVRTFLTNALGSGTPTAAQAARALHMSVRTLHRSLLSEGTSFRELLDQLRQERASGWLANPRCSIAEVSFLLGFAELSSFYRAFKRWTGKTPAEFRAQILAASAAAPNRPR